MYGDGGVSGDGGEFGPLTAGEKEKIVAEQNREDEKSGPAIGEVMPDGTVYASVSPETGKAMFTTAADAPATCTFNQAQENAVKLDARGRRDWRVPTKDELNVLYQNRAAIGGFEEPGSDPVGWYWSSSQFNEYIAWGQRFSDGHQDFSNKSNVSSLRCVR
jgi:hypothetical protein